MTHFGPNRAILDLATGHCVYAALPHAQPHVLERNAKGHFLIDIIAFLLATNDSVQHVGHSAMLVQMDMHDETGDAEESVSDIIELYEGSWDTVGVSKLEQSDPGEQKGHAQEQHAVECGASTRGWSQHRRHSY
eukprot:1180852-Alexandrium_andersonii.AAC.1